MDTKIQDYVGCTCKYVCLGHGHTCCWFEFTVLIFGPRDVVQNVFVLIIGEVLAWERSGCIGVLCVYQVMGSDQPSVVTL